MNKETVRDVTDVTNELNFSSLDPPVITVGIFARYPRISFMRSSGCVVAAIALIGLVGRHQHLAYRLRHRAANGAV